MARLNEPPAAPAVSATVLAGGVGGVESVDAREYTLLIQCILDESIRCLSLCAHPDNAHQIAPSTTPKAEFIS